MKFYGLRLIKLNPYDVLGASLAISMQVLVTLSIYGTEIRVASADLLLPIILILIFFQFQNDGFRYLKWRLPNLPGWLVLLSILLSVSLIRGVYFTGELQTWALVNKYIGWYILVIFFVSGGIVSHLSSRSGKRLFLCVIVFTACIIGVLDSVSYLQTMRGFGQYYRMEGFAGNPNAYGFLLVVIALIVQAQNRFRPIFSRYIDIICVAWLMALIVMSGSRSAWLAMLIGTLTLAMARRLGYLGSIFSIILGVFIVISFNSIGSIERQLTSYKINEERSSVTAQIVSEVPAYITRKDILNDSGVNHRLDIMHNAFELWKQSPIFGVGLGGFRWSELKVGRTAVIHTTALWLLVETGIVGIIIFSIYFLNCIWKLWISRSEDDDGLLIVGSLAVLSAFVGASLGMEVMYQRHIWFFAGWALSHPIKNCMQPKIV